MANLDHVLILPGEAVFAAGRYRRVSHERPGSRTPRPADDAPGSASGKGRDTRPMSISGPNANTAVSPAPARRRAAPGTFRLSEGKHRGARPGRRRRCARRAALRRSLPGKGSKTDRAAQAGGQARPSRARCARRVQDRPARRHSVPGRAEQAQVRRRRPQGRLEGRWPRWRARRDRAPGRGRDRQDGGALAHVPEKCKPVFRIEHAQNQRIQD